MRRIVLALALALSATMGAGAGETGKPRLIALDWGLATTLLGIGVEVSGVPEKPAFLDWVQEPAPAPSSPDLGLRLAPDMERLEEADPDFILISPQFASIEKRLESIAPVRSFAIFTPEKTPLANARSVTRALGDLAENPEGAEALIADTDSAIAALREKAEAQSKTCGFLVVNFVRGGTVRVFGEGSLYGGVLEEAGLANGWTGATNFWGFATVPVSELLHHPDDELIIVSPVPVEVRQMLEAGDGVLSTGLFGKIPALRKGRYTMMRPVWSFGGLTEARTFARELSATDLPDCSNDNS